MKRTKQTLKKRRGNKKTKIGKQFEQQHHTNHVQGPSRRAVKGEQDTKTLLHIT
jgi:hypothetical protein